MLLHMFLVPLLPLRCFILVAVTTVPTPNAINYEEEENDLYLEFSELNDAMMSTDSSKKCKLEEGDKCSSHTPN